MTLDQILVLAITGASVLLFISERLRVDVVALMVLAALSVSGLLTVEETFAGFASPAVVTVWAVFIISGALFRCGIADLLARLMVGAAGHSLPRLIVVLMVTAGLMSAFINNIGAVAVLMPGTIRMARDANLPPSKLLMPLAFGSLMGGNLTLIGTPPNILASTILEGAGLPGFAFFDFLPLGALMLAGGIVYMLTVGRRLLPDRRGRVPVNGYQLQDYVSEVRVMPGSRLIGHSATESRLGERHDLSILAVIRAEHTLVPDDLLQFEIGDLLMVEGGPQQLLEVSARYNLQLVAGWTFEQFAALQQKEEFRFAELTLSPDSHLIGMTLREIDFRDRFDLTVIAIRRAGRTLLARLGDLPLSFGDAVLVAGPPDAVEALRGQPDLLLLDSPPLPMVRLHRARRALLILVGVVVVLTAGWLPTATAMMVGALLTVLLGVQSMREAQESIDWQAVFLIAGMLPLGTALEKSGTAALLAAGVVDLMGGAGAYPLLIGLFILTALLTEVISNAAATVLIVPIAMDVALRLGASPHAFVMAVVLAASTSFLTPIGHQANVLIYGPGNYRFGDYVRVGGGLNLVALGIVSLFLPFIWPLYP